MPRAGDATAHLRVAVNKQFRSRQLVVDRMIDHLWAWRARRRGGGAHVQGRGRNLMVKALCRLIDGVCIFLSRLRDCRRAARICLNGDDGHLWRGAPLAAHLMAATRSGDIAGVCSALANARSGNCDAHASVPLAEYFSRAGLPGACWRLSACRTIFTWLQR